MKTILRTTGMWIWLTIVGAMLFGGWWYAANSPRILSVSSQSGMTCDMGISAAEGRPRHCHGECATGPGRQPTITRIFGATELGTTARSGAGWHGLDTRW